MEYVQDILVELRLLLCSSALPPEEHLRVLLTAAKLVQAEVGMRMAGQDVRCCACAPSWMLSSACQPKPLQGDVLASGHATFCSEAYAALVHTMLVPLLEDSSGMPGSKACDANYEEDTILTSVLAFVNVKAGEQVIATHDYLFYMLKARDLFLVTGKHSVLPHTCHALQVCFLVTSILQTLILDAKALDPAQQVRTSRHFAFCNSAIHCKVDMSCMVHGWSVLLQFSQPTLTVF